MVPDIYRVVNIDHASAGPVTMPPPDQIRSVKTSTIPMLISLSKR